MAIRCVMNWQASRATWYRMYLGKQYQVSCRQLRNAGLPADDSKAGSYAAANAWWLAKQLEIDNANIVFALDTGRRLTRIAPKPSGSLADNQKLGAFMHASELHEDESGTLYRNRRLVAPSDYQRGYWASKSENREAVKIADTVGTQVDRYMEFLKTKAAAGENSATSLGTITSQMNRIAGIIGRANPVASINETTCSKVWTALANLKADGEIGGTTARHNYGRFKTFVRWLDGEDLIERLPKNLTKYRFAEDETATTVLDFAELRRLLAVANPRMRLIMLLGLNLGFTQTGMAHFDRGKIIDGRYSNYKREKTQRSKGVPKVSYLLWEETLEALAAAELPTVPNKIYNIFLTFKINQKLTWSLGAFRSTAASAILNSDYSQYVDYFLGHAPESISAKHYVLPSQEKFDAALNCLRSQIFDAAAA